MISITKPFLQFMMCRLLIKKLTRTSFNPKTKDAGPPRFDLTHKKSGNH